MDPRKPKFTDACEHGEHAIDLYAKALALIEATRGE